MDPQLDDKQERHDAIQDRVNGGPLPGEPGNLGPPDPKPGPAEPKPKLPELKEIALSQADSIEGFMTKGGLDVLFEAALAHGREGNTIVEVGTLYGRSTIVLALGAWAHKEIFMPTPGSNPAQVISIDRDPVSLTIAHSNLLEVGIRPQDMHLFTADSALKLRTLGRRIDLAFIDGDHYFPGVFVDIAIAARLLKVGGTIIMHDYNWHTGVFQAANTLIKDNPAFENFQVEQEANLAWASKASEHVGQFVVTTAGQQLKSRYEADRS